MSSPRSLDRLLLASVVEHDRNAPLDNAAALARRGSLAELPALADFHGVSGCVWHSLRGSGADEAVLDALERATTAGLARHLAALGDLDRIARTFDAAGIPWIVFKGPVIAETLYARPDLRVYGDLDLLVPAARFGDAIAALEGDGAEVRDRNWRLLRGEMRGQIHLWLGYGSAADLHWHLVNRGRDALNVPIEELFERSRSVSLNGVVVRTFEPADTLVHLAVHAGLEGAHRLVWLKDVERAVAAGGFNWDVVVERAAAWGAAPLVALVLGRARRAVGAAVPDGVLSSLAGPLRRLAFASADRLWRASALERRPVPYLLGAAGARGIGWTAGAFGRRALRSALGRPGDTPATVLKDDGGESDRLGYLAAVASRGAAGLDIAPDLRRRG